MYLGEHEGWVRLFAPFSLSGSLKSTTVGPVAWRYKWILGANSLIGCPHCPTDSCLSIHCFLIDAHHHIEIEWMLGVTAPSSARFWIGHIQLQRKKSKRVREKVRRMSWLWLLLNIDETPQQTLALYYDAGKATISVCECSRRQF